MTSQGAAADDISGILRGPFASLPRWAAADAPRFVFALNVALVTALSLFISFVLDIAHSYWCLLTVALVVQASSGLTVWRSVTRTVGTLVGCLVGLAFVGFFAQNGLTMIAALALWLFAASYFARYELGLDAYSYCTAGLTALIIALDTGANADQAYGLAVERTSETLIPIFASFVVTLVIFPLSASKGLLEGLYAAREGVLKLSRHALVPDEDLSPGLTQTVARGLSASYANLRALRLERSHRRLSAGKAEQATNDLNRVVIDIGRVSFTLAALREAMPDTVAAKVGELRRLVDAVPAHDAGIDALRRAAATFRDFVSGLDVASAIERVKREPDAGRELIALDALRRFAASMAVFLDADAAIIDPNQPAPTLRPMRTRYLDQPAAIMRGLRPAVILIVLGMVWITTASSSFQTLALICGGMTMTLPAIAPRAGMLVGGKLIGLGMAAMFLPVLALEMTLPYVETFPAYALLIGSVMFVFNYICYNPMLKTYAIGGAILLSVTLQPSNTETYDPVGLFNAAATLAFLPLAIGSAFTVIFPEDQGWLRRRLRSASSRLLERAASGKDDHLDEFVAQSLDAVGDYGGDLDLNDPKNRPYIERSHAVATAGVELYELARLKRLGHLPPDIAARLPAVGEAIRAEAQAGSGSPPKGDPLAILREARDAGYRAYAEGERSDLSAQAALRFAVGAELLQRAAAEGRFRVGA